MIKSSDNALVHLYRTESDWRGRGGGEGGGGRKGESGGKRGGEREGS